MRLRSPVLTLIIAILWLPTAAQAASDLHQQFAQCVGRLSAQIEHDTKVQAERIGETKSLLAAFQDLTEATALQTHWRDTIDMRVRAKLAHQAILNRTIESTKSSEARWAERRAAAEIARCRSFLLGG